MLMNRAVEIVESLGVTNVTYKNEAVWIENIDEERKTAFVKNLNTGDSEQVEIAELKE